MHSKLDFGGHMWTKSGFKDARCESLFFTIHSVATMLVTLFPVLRHVGKISSKGLTQDLRGASDRSANPFSLTERGGSCGTPN